MEGKETRYGIWASALFAVSTTLTSCGAANSSHDSYTPGGGGMTIFNMMLGEIAPGGAGSGLYGILILAIVAVFVAGLMVGRTPEYLGKKLRGREMKFASLYILTTPAVALVGAGLAMALPGERAAMLNSGPHGFSEVLYAFASAANNNGSAFAGLSVNTVWYNTTLGVVMLVGRFLPMVFVLALMRLARRATTCSGHRGHPAHSPAAVRRAVDRSDPHRCRSDLLPRARARTPGGGPALMSTTAAPAPTPPGAGRQQHRVPGGLLDPRQLLTSFPDALRKLDPRVMVRNPVMFVVEVGAVLTTLSAIRAPSVFAWVITGWLWLTSVFANLAEAVAEGRGKAQAETLRRARTTTVARRLTGWRPGATDAAEQEVPGAALRLGDHVVVEAGQTIPGDGDVVEGIASVDESAITGESAPVIRESGGDRSAVTGGTKVLSDRIIVKITSKPGRPSSTG